MPVLKTINVGAAYAGQSPNGFDTLHNAFATYINTRDIVLNDEVIEVRVHDNQTIINATQYMAATYDATHYVRILPAAGKGVNELNTTGALDYGTVGVELVYNLTSTAPRISHGCSMEGFRITCNNAGASSPGIWLARAGTSSTTYPNDLYNCRMLKNRIKHIGNYSAVSMNNNGAKGIFEDNLIFNESATGIPFIGREGSFQRNTIVGRGSGAARSGAESLNASSTWRDNVFVGCGGQPLVRTAAPSTIDTNFTDTAITTGSATGFTVASGLIVSTTDARPATGGPLIGAASASSNNTTDIRGNFRGTDPDAGAAMLAAATLPNLANATITNVGVVGQKVTVSGTYTNIADLGTCTIPVGATPNGAVAKSQAVSVNSANSTFTTTFTNVQPGNYGIPTVALTNASGTGTSTGGNTFTVAVPAVPTVTITAQSKTSNSVTVSGTTTGNPVSGTVTLTAIGNGAVTKTGQLTLNDGGTFTVTLTSVATGDYQGPVVSVTNFSGTGSATGAPLSMYASGSAPQGMPAVVLPAFTPPAFNAPTVAEGGIVTTITLQNTTSTVATNEPFTIGHPFKKGQLRPQDTLIGKIAGQADLQLQFNVKATHEDGSVRHAIISGILPSLAADASVAVGLARSSAAGNYSAASLSAAYSAGARGRANVNIGGVAYYATMDDALAGTEPYQVWLSGPVCTEWIINTPLRDNSFVAHPHLTAQIAVRYYPNLGRAKVDVTMEHAKAYLSTADLTYDINILIGTTTNGTDILAMNQTGLVHYPLTRYRTSAWWISTSGNHASVPSKLHVKYDIPYLLDTKQVPNYDRTVVPHEAGILDMLADENNKVYGPMQYGPINRSMGTTGGRPDIGLMPKWYAGWLLSQDKRLYDMMLRVAQTGCSFQIHRRDHSNEGPVRGHPIDVVHWPYATEKGTSTDARNPATGISEKFPATTTVNPSEPDLAHQPAFSYLPYMVTGDYFHMEELLFWAGWSGSQLHPGYRFYHRNIVKSEQVRGQGWTLRTYGMCRAIVPDSHPLKPSYAYYVDENMSWYNAEYTDNASANKLGVIVNGVALVSGVDDALEVAVRTWMDDFFTQSVGFNHDLGHPQAQRLLQWKAKFPAGRMLGPGWCWIMGAVYDTRIKPSTGAAYYDNIGQAYQGTMTSMSAALASAGCNSPEMRAAMKTYYNLTNDPIPGQMTGYPTDPEGFPSNMQPALAYTADSGFTDGNLAWDQFESRSLKPDYRYGPQFAIVPRTYTATPISGTVPGAPTNVVATVLGNATTDKVQVSFTAPASNGGQPITSYTVTASNGYTESGGSSPILMEVGMVGYNASVTFTVRATNVIGSGAASAASNAITITPPFTPTKPSQVLNVVATALDGAVRVTFDPPVDTGGVPIVKYIAYRVDAPSTDFVEGTSSPLTLNVANGVPTAVIVLADNGVQVSDASAPSNTVTPAAAYIPSVSVQLVDAANAPVANLTGLKWAWFDQSLPQSFNTPVNKGADGATDATGKLVLSLPNSTLQKGNTGWLIVTNSTGNPAFEHSAFSGPLALE